MKMHKNPPEKQKKEGADYRHPNIQFTFMFIKFQNKYISRYELWTVAKNKWNVFAKFFKELLKVL